MNERTIAKMLGPHGRRIANMLARGSVVLANASAKMQRLQVKLLGSESAELEHFEPYGFTSKPKSGAEVLTMFFDGDRSHGVVFIAADRRYRLQGLEDGEVALHDDQGQCVHFKQGGQLYIKANAKLLIEVPDAEITGNLKVGGDLVADGEVKDQGGAKSMSGMRSIFNGHDHPETGGTTNDPNQEM